MDLEKQDNRINKVVETALKNISEILNVSTVVGKPIKTDDGDYIFPVAKVTLAVLSGGGEYGKINLFKKSSDLPYSAGNGAIVSVKPSGFLVKDNNANFKILSVKDNTYEKIFESATEFFSGITTKGESDEDQVE